MTFTDRGTGKKRMESEWTLDGLERRFMDARERIPLLNVFQFLPQLERDRVMAIAGAPFE